MQEVEIRILPEADDFSQCGENLWYAFFNRKSSPRTTWYVFFEKCDNRILVKHISNNWLEGQYIR